METDKLSNPWPGVTHAVPDNLSYSPHTKDTVASVNNFLLKMSIDIAQDNINAVRSGTRQDLTFEAQQSVIRKIAKFFNPAWKIL